jgi:hypothetical protein
MTTPSPSIGFQSQVALSATSSFSSSSLWIEMISESIAHQGVILDTNGIRGRRSRDGSRVRTGPYKVGGQLSCYVDKNVLDVFLSYILGGTVASQVYPLADALPSFYLLIDRVAKVFTIGPCYVSKATFSASAGSGDQNQLKLTMDIEAVNDSVGDAGTFSSATSGITPNTSRPYIFADSMGGLTVNATVYSSFGFELTIDNHLLADRFVNELYRSQIPAVDRTVTCKLTTPFTSNETALYGVAVGSFGTASFVFANAEETISSTQSQLTFTVGGVLQYPQKSPVVRGKTSEIHLEIDSTARTTTSGTTVTPELSITNTHG